jgi:hypothetical protein
VRIGIRTALGAAGSLLLLSGVGWLGLQVKPSPFASHPEKTHDLGPVEVPSGLPGPVRRHYLAVLGERARRIETAVVWGTGELRLGGVRCPVRFRAYYDASAGAFRRDMEVTWFGAPVFQGRDTYLQDKGVMRISGLRGLVRATYEGEGIDQGGNLAMWGELLGYAPQTLLLDPRVRWEESDASSARLIVPFGHQEDSLRVDFEPGTGLMIRVSGMRYRGQEETKTPWRGESSTWGTVQGMLVPQRLTGRWEDQKEPYVVLELEGAAYNVDVSEKVRGAVPSHISAASAGNGP